MQIERVAIVGRGAVGLMYGSIMAEHLGTDAVIFAMDDERFYRHAGEQVTVNGAPLAVRTIPMSEAEPVDLVILAVKARDLDAAIESMAPLVGPHTVIESLLNGITSEERIAARYGWEHTVLGICQGMDAVYLDGALTFSHAGEIRFGAAPGTAAGVVEALDDLYTRAGISHVVEADPRRRMWVKLMLNVGINQTCMAHRDGDPYCFARSHRHALDGAGPHRAPPYRGRGVLGHYLPPRRQTRHPRAHQRMALPTHSRNRKRLVAPARIAAPYGRDAKPLKGGVDVDKKPAK